MPEFAAYVSITDLWRDARPGAVYLPILHGVAELLAWPRHLVVNAINHGTDCFEVAGVV